MSQSTSVSLRGLGLYGLGLASAAYSFSFLSNWETPLSTAFGWYFQDIAILSVLPFAGVFALGAAAYATGSSALLQAKSSLSLLATPLAVTVCLFSYTTKIVNRKLTEVPGHVMPVPGHLSIHLVPAVLLLVDLFAYNGAKFAASSCKAFIIHYTVMLSYWAWIELCYYKTGWWYVDWIEQLSYPQRALFIAAWSGLMTGSYAVLKAMKRA